MGTMVDRVTRGLSPITLLIAAVVFLLPFCSASCNSPFGGTANFVTASGLNLVIGGDVGLDCDSLNRLGNQVGSAVGAPSGSTSSSCGSSPSGSSPSSGVGGTSLGASQHLGPFSGTSGGGNTVHVDLQPLAIAAAACLIAGILASGLRRRLRGALSALLAVGGLACLIVLRVILTNRFNDDIRASATSSPSSGTTGGSGGLGNIDPTSLFSLSWGSGWLISVAAAAVAVIVNLVALAAPGRPRALTPEAAGGWGATPAPGWGAPPPPPGSGHPGTAPPGGPGQFGVPPSGAPGQFGAPPSGAPGQFGAPPPGATRQFGSPPPGGLGPVGSPPGTPGQVGSPPPPPSQPGFGPPPQRPPG